MESHCAVLGVPRDCTDTTALKEAYKQASLRCHPDRGGSSRRASLSLRADIHLNVLNNSYDRMYFLST